MTDTIFFGGGLPDPSLRPDLAGLVADVLREEPQAYSYGGLWGDEHLRELLAARLGARAGTPLDGGNVVITQGSAGALELVAANLIEPGTVVAVEVLTYPGAVEIFRRRGAHIVTVPVDADGLDVDALEELLGATPRANRPSIVYTIATCQSPTGTILAPDRRRRLVELAEREGLTILQDDTYGEILFDVDDSAARPLIGLDPTRVIHLGSCSKVLAPGLRMGWLAARRDTCEVIAGRRTDIGNPPALHKAVARFFDQGLFEPHLTTITDVYRRKRDLLLAALERHCAGLGTWNCPRGGFFSWFVLGSGDVAAVEPVAAQEGVAFLAGPYFSAGDRFGRGIRLAYGELPADRLDEGARRLGRAVERARTLAAR